VLWYPLGGPNGGAWASVVGMAVAILVLVHGRRRVLAFAGAVLVLVVFAIAIVLLTLEPGEALWISILKAPSRAAFGLPTALPVVSLIAGAWVAARSRPSYETWCLRWVVVAGALTFLTEYPRMDDVHLAWSAGLPLVAGCVVLGRLHTSLTERWRVGSIGRAVLAVALLWVPVALMLPNVVGRTDGYFFQADDGSVGLKPMETVSGVPAVEGLSLTTEEASQLLAAARFVDERTAPGEPIFVYPSSPLLYVLTRRPNPSRFAHLYPGAASAAELDHLIAILDQTPVRVVVVSSAALDFWGPPGPNLPLETYLAQTYPEAARFGEYRVLIRRSQP
jgi:hypothetical protein